MEMSTHSSFLLIPTLEGSKDNSRPLWVASPHFQHSPEPAPWLSGEVHQQVQVLFSLTCLRIIFQLLERQSGREGKTKGSAGSLRKWSQQLGWGQSETRSLELYPGLPHGCRHPTSWAIFQEFPRYITQELDGKWNSQDRYLNGNSITPHIRPGVNRELCMLLNLGVLSS